MDVSVIVPTYQEADNLPILVPRLAAALGRAGLAYEILVVDDASPDGTRMACDRLARRYRLRLIVRQGERGLATAVLCGLRAAEGAQLVVMSADLSHAPEMVPALLGPLRDGRADFVLGSTGGTGAAGESLLRRAGTRLANLLAWPLTWARDPLSGFFALGRSTFLASAPLGPIGDRVGLELIVKCGCRRVVEVPVGFRNELPCPARLCLGEQVGYLRHLARLYRHRLFTRRKPPPPPAPPARPARAA
jgi:dolichol-phosphate mannosyltransferase